MGYTERTDVGYRRGLVVQFCRRLELTKRRKATESYRRDRSADRLELRGSTVAIAVKLGAQDLARVRPSGQDGRLIASKPFEETS